MVAEAANISKVEAAQTWGCVTKRHYVICTTVTHATYSKAVYIPIQGMHKHFQVTFNAKFTKPLKLIETLL